MNCDACSGSEVCATKPPLVLRSALSLTSAVHRRTGSAAQGQLQQLAKQLEDMLATERVGSCRLRRALLAAGSSLRGVSLCCLLPAACGVSYAACCHVRRPQAQSEEMAHALQAMQQERDGAIHDARQMQAYIEQLQVRCAVWGVQCVVLRCPAQRSCAGC